MKPLSDLTLYIIKFSTASTPRVVTVVRAAVCHSRSVGRCVQLGSLLSRLLEPPLIPLLSVFSQMNPIYVFNFYMLKIYFNIILSSILDLNSLFTLECCSYISYRYILHVQLILFSFI